MLIGVSEVYNMLIGVSEGYILIGVRRIFRSNVFRSDGAPSM